MQLAMETPLRYNSPVLETSRTVCSQPSKFADHRQFSPSFLLRFSRNKACSNSRRHPARKGAGSQYRAVAIDDLLPGLAFVAPVCFSQECQVEADRTFLIAICTPILVLLAALVYIYWSPGQLKGDNKDRFFSDPQTGIAWEAKDGDMPERDKQGELAFRPISYTPWPVPQGEPGDRVRVDVGPAARRQPRTFVFSRVLPQPSRILSATLPRPMGIIFEEDKARGQVVVGGFMDGSEADRRCKVAKLNRALQDATPLVGDVLRACSCTNFVYPTQSLFGAKAPTRTIVLYGADKQSWPQVTGALRKGDRRDGEVTLVLERRLSVEESQSVETRLARLQAGGADRPDR